MTTAPGKMWLDVAIRRKGSKSQGQTLLIEQIRAELARDLHNEEESASLFTPLAATGIAPTPISTAAPSAASSTSPAGPPGFMPPMTPGMMGAAGGAGRESPRAAKSSERDELLNGDDLLNRAADGRI